MTTKQRKERIRYLVLAGADITRHPRRPIDTELHTLLAPAAGRRPQRQQRRRPAEGGVHWNAAASYRPTHDRQGDGEQIRYAALYR